MTSKKSKSGQDWWHDLTDEQKQHINEGLTDAENGRVVTSEIFWDKLKNSQPIQIENYPPLSF